MCSAKVTPIDLARSKGAEFRQTPLDICRERACSALTAAWSEVLQKALERLLKLADQAAEAELYHLYLDTLELVKRQRNPLEQGFRAHYLQHFNLACRPDRRSQDVLSMDPDQLTLVEPDDLEKRLAGESLANNLYNACSEELFGLDRRMGVLLDDPELTQRQNPLGPEAISQAILACLDDVEARLKVRLLLVSLLSRNLPERVKAVYHELNLLLIDKGVLPSIRSGLRRRRPLHDADAEPPASAAPGGDLFRTLQALMGQSPTGHGPAIPFPLASATQVRNDAATPGAMASAGDGIFTASPERGLLMMQLTALQRGETPPGLAAPLDLAPMTTARGNVLHGLRNSALSQAMNPLDRMTLDIVAMIFDYILDDARLPDAIKALIGRLQIPALKVAMEDKTLFSQRTHPVRQLLDTLAEAGIGWDPSEGHGSRLYLKIDELVLRIQNQFDQGTDIFQQALTELRQFMGDEASQAAQAATPSALAVLDQERLQHARRRAHDEVQTLLLNHPVLPEIIRDFALRAWEPLLAGLLLEQDETSPDWLDNRATLDELFWSVQPKHSQEARKHLLEILPGMLRKLSDGMARVRYPDLDRTRLLAALVELHADAVNGETSTPQPSTLQEAQPEAAWSALPEQPGAAEFEPVQPVSTVAAAPEAPAPLDPESAPAACTLHTASGVQTLARGNWIDYHPGDGTTVRMKLTWISPLKGLYLFTNRLGERAMSISREGLAQKLDSGQVTLVESEPLLDRALDHLVRDLGRQAAG